MKIISRPQEDADITVGGGRINMRFSQEQLELVAALVTNCRLGQGTYSQAAYEILEMIEEEFGSDYVNDAHDLIDLQVTVEDRQGNVVFSTKSGDYYTTLEV